MAIDTLTAALKVSMNWSAEKAIAGREPVTNTQTVAKTISYSDATSATSASGANEQVGHARYISSGGTDTLDLSAALENVVRDTGITLARVKAIMFQVLGSGETLGPSGSEVTGTNCTGIRVGAAGSNPWKGFFGTTASSLDVLSGGSGGFAAVGTNAPQGVHVSGGMNDTLLITNLDASNTAVYFIGLIGAGN